MVKYKKIMKSNDSTKLGGVLSGVGRYFEIDPFVLRLVFALLFIFSAGGLLLITYFVAWAVMDDFDENQVEVTQEKEHEEENKKTTSE